MYASVFIAAFAVNGGAIYSVIKSQLGYNIFHFKSSKYWLRMCMLSHVLVVLVELMCLLRYWYLTMISITVIIVCCVCIYF